MRDVYRHVLAPLRNRIFYSLGELNQGMHEQLSIWHDRNFQGRHQSRRQRFELSEQPALQELPSQAFQIKKYASLTLRNNCHIQIREDQHYYSAPYGYAGKKVQVIYTPERVQIFCNDVLIAAHLRNLPLMDTLQPKNTCRKTSGTGWIAGRAGTAAGRLISPGRLPG